MKFYIAGLLLSSVLLAADRKIEPIKTGDDAVDIVAAAINGRDQVKAALGVDPETEMIAIDVKLSPKGDRSLTISRDDFTLISRRDGQKCGAMHPSQIAGNSVMIVSSTAPGAGGGMIGNRRGPIWGGMPGTSDRPRRLGGDDEATGSVTPGETKATISDSGKKDNPVLAALKSKELPQGKTSEPKAGLLYFTLEGKHKLKDLELLYKGPEGPLEFDFQK